ncbi:helix-turn-helix domain-containing protein [Desemzia sp. FAM 24101]|uniref:helix-turn-helix domain-containing protein n=1 Tax=unclassified Desemzia TaxID=2685243 RepID=UPI0038892A28
MKIENFLEKHEIREITIFQKLVLSGGQVGYTEMIDHLDISKASLDKDLEAITFRFQSISSNVRIDYDGHMISLFMGHEFSLEQIYQHYLRQSIKVSIISYLYEHQEFTITQLAQKLTVSESSLFRKIKELNSYLKEFQIKIRNGRLQGEELQIRYFYYQFYWYIADKSALASQKNDDQVERMTQAMENFLQATFDSESKQRIGVWFHISKNRVNSRSKVYKFLHQQMEPYHEDPMYHKVRTMVLRFFSRYSIEVDEEEGMMHFIFLLAFPILSENDFHEYTLLRGRRTPTAALDTYIVETIIIQYNLRKLPYMLEREMYYFLSQIHTRMYFFKGDIEIYDYDAILAKEKKFTGKDLLSFAKQLRDISIGKLNIEETDGDTLLKMELLKYVSLLAIVTFQTATILQIGIDLKMESIYTKALNQLLVMNMKHINGTHIEKYDPKKDYDLILTNVPQNHKDRYGKAKVYVLSEILSPFDQKNIQEILQTLNQ